jgi:hypothetical protein
MSASSKLCGKPKRIDCDRVSHSFKIALGPRIASRFNFDIGPENIVLYCALIFCVFVADGFVLPFAPPNPIGRASPWRLIQINAALIRRTNFHAGGCEQFMKVHAIQMGSDRGPGAWPAATSATMLLGRFENAHPIDLAQRVQPVKAGFRFRMEKR